MCSFKIKHNQALSLVLISLIIHLEVFHKCNLFFLQTEIQLVQSIGVPPERIIYANPCKQVSQIKHAASSGVQMMTFDSEVELMKVARAHPKAK